MAHKTRLFRRTVRLVPSHGAGRPCDTAVGNSGRSGSVTQSSATSSDHHAAAAGTDDAAGVTIRAGPGGFRSRTKSRAVAGSTTSCSRTAKASVRTAWRANAEPRRHDESIGTDVTGRGADQRGDREDRSEQAHADRAAAVDRFTSKFADASSAGREASLLQ